MKPRIKKRTQSSTEHGSLKCFHPKLLPRVLSRLLSRVTLIFGLQLAVFSVAWAQTPAAADTNQPLLTLDEALRIANSTNREIHISKIEIIKAQETVAQTRTNYLPKLDANVLAGAPLQPLNFRVPAGSFGPIRRLDHFPRLIRTFIHQ